MLTILFNWVYMFFTVFSLGYGVSCFTERFLACRIRRLDSVLLAGVIAATVYAQFFSLFYKVALAANVLLLCGCVMILFHCRKRLCADLRAYIGNNVAGSPLVIAGLLLLWSYFTAAGYLHYDSDLYHAQSIRWIEEYGVVKGLGNLHERFAYNSALFALSALYSMKFLLGSSLHAVSGFFAFLLSLSSAEVWRAWKRRRLFLSDYARLAAIYYLTTIWDEVVSPASDYSIMCMIFYILIRWLSELERQREEKESSIAPFALLCVAGVYALTLKLTAGLILLLVAKPTLRLVREKRWREIGIYLGMGLLVAAPWLVRNVLISGWLLYPFPALDLFRVDWKMPAKVVQMDAAGITSWARGLYDAAKANLPPWEWLSGWFEAELSKTEKLLILADLAGCVLTALFAVCFGVRRLKECRNGKAGRDEPQHFQKEIPEGDVLLVLATLCASYLFWQFSAPMIRYGYAYVLLFAALTLGYAVKKWFNRDGLLRICLLLYGLYKLGMMGLYVGETCGQDRYIRQAEYGSYELGTYELNGITFYYPLVGDRTGYEAFPASPRRDGFELRGEGLEDGFRSIGADGAWNG